MNKKFTENNSRIIEGLLTDTVESICKKLAIPIEEWIVEDKFVVNKQLFLAISNSSNLLSAKDLLDQYNRIHEMSIVGTELDSKWEWLKDIVILRKKEKK